MGLPFNATIIVLSVAVFSGCDRSDDSRAAKAIPDYSEYGVVTAPQIGHLPEQPNFDSQLNVTTATTAVSDKSSTAPHLGNKPSTGGSVQTGSTTAPQSGGTTAASAATTAPQ